MKKILVPIVFITVLTTGWSQHEVEIEDIDGDGDAVLQISDPLINTIFGINQSSGGFVRTLSNHDLYFETSNVESLRILDTGFIGIHTALPLGPLHVRDSVKNFGERGDALFLETTDNNLPTITWLDTTGGANSIILLEYDYQGLNFHHNNELLSSHKTNGLNTFYHKTSNLTRRGLRIHNINSGAHWDWHVVPATNPTLQLISSEKDPLLTGSFDLVSGEYKAMSDRRQKKNFSLLTAILPSVLALKPLQYQFVSQPIHSTEKHLGFIAQDVKKYFPELVSQEEASGHHLMDYNGFGILAIAAIQEQQERIHHLMETQIKLKSALMELKKLIAENHIAY